MTDFSAAWLALREPYDRAARSQAVLGALGTAFAKRTSIAVVDLGCGTGATLRAICVQLPQRQSWRLVDNDLGLLARASDSGKPPHVTVVTRPIDLARDLELALVAPLDLVTTSALLDLVSPEWLDRLIVETAARQLPVYASLTYDGRIDLAPESLGDRELLAGFNLHQRTDKGFGAALGPAAAARAIERFEHFGYTVVQGRSDWVLGPSARAIQEALFVAWADLGALTAELPAGRIADWLARRRELLAQGRSSLRIGHVDIFAQPVGRR